MNQLQKLRIEGFRRLNAVSLEMRPMMATLGANGSGKSSLLDAISLLSASATGNLNRALSDLGGLADVLTRGRSEDLVLGLAMDVPGHEPLEYGLSIAPGGIAYSISNEQLLQQNPGHPGPFKHIDSKNSDVKYYDTEARKIVRPTWEHNPLETSLSQVPKMFSQPEDLRRLLGEVIHYHFLDVGHRAPVKLPQQLKPASTPGVNGEELIPFLYSLKESHRDRFETIEDTLKVAFPHFESLRFPPVAAGMMSLAWKDKNFKDPLYAHQLSEGTLRFLWLVALLQSPQPATITMIDEPEVSLHPELLALLAELLREASKRTQIIVATHSDRLIRFLEPREVVVVDIDEKGFTTATWADTLDLEDWLREYTLDELWSLGRLGGRA